MSTPTHTVRLADVLRDFAPGSFDQPWSWDDERDWLDSQVCLVTGAPGGYQAALERHLQLAGQVDQGILLGDDGRVWDGHHRVVAAARLGIPQLQAECFCGTEVSCTALPYAI